MGWTPCTFARSTLERSWNPLPAPLTALSLCELQGRHALAPFSTLDYSQHCRLLFPNSLPCPHSSVAQIRVHPTPSGVLPTSLLEGEACSPLLRGAAAACNSLNRLDTCGKLTHMRHIPLVAEVTDWRDRPGGHRMEEKRFGSEATAHFHHCFLRI